MQKYSNYKLIYFNQISNIDNEYIIISIKNNKILLFDNNNNKIYIKKRINPNKDKGKFILNYLGYNNENYVKYILICRFYYKSNKIINLFNNLFNYYNVLLIIIGQYEPIRLYKYIINNNNYKYNNTFINYN